MNVREFGSHRVKTVQIYFPQSEAGVHGKGLEGKLVNDGDSFIHLKSVKELDAQDPKEYKDLRVGKIYVLKFIPFTDIDEIPLSDSPIDRGRFSEGDRELESYRGKVVQIYFPRSEYELHGEGLKGKITHYTEHFVHLKNAEGLGDIPAKYDEISIGKRYIVTMVPVEKAEENSTA